MQYQKLFIPPSNTIVPVSAFSCCLVDSRRDLETKELTDWGVMLNTCKVPGAANSVLLPPAPLKGEASDVEVALDTAVVIGY